MFSIWDSKEKYIQEFSALDDNLDCEIPIYIDKNRIDLINISKKYTLKDYDRISIYQSEYGIVLSDIVNFYSKNRLLCKSWINLDEFSKVQANKTVTIIGLYKEFSQIKLQQPLQYFKDKKIRVYFLIGRDLSSLSWLVAKQFVMLKGGKKGLFTYKKLNFDVSDYSDWEIADIHSIDKNEVKRTIETGRWSQIIFHGHGKEDNLNLSEYTICGLNKSANDDNNLYPSCGYIGQNCFKDNGKIIRLNNIQAEQISLLSCNNFPLYDTKLYSSKYNLALNAIDGYASNILCSIGIQSTDNPEIDLLFRSKDLSNIGVELHEKLDDIQPFVSIINIGLPKEEIKNVSKNIYVGMSKLSKIMLTRLSLYKASHMLSPNHSINKLSSKIIRDYSQMTRRGTIGVTYKEMKKFEEDLINRINPFSKVVADKMLDLNDDLHDFDTFNIYRSSIVTSSIKTAYCSCGRKGLTYKYQPNIPTLFEIEVQYCYRCGDKQVGMSQMPDIEFKCDVYSERVMNIYYQADIFTADRGDVFIGITVPSYIQQYVNNPTKIQKIKNRCSQVIHIEGKVEFRKEIPKQSYYLILWVVQNGGIKVSRCFFNLIE